MGTRADKSETGGPLAGDWALLGCQPLDVAMCSPRGVVI